jgi:hypothetical protein
MTRKKWLELITPAGADLQSVPVYKKYLLGPDQ